MVMLIRQAIIKTIIVVFGSFAKSTCFDQFSILTHKHTLDHTYIRCALNLDRSMATYGIWFSGGNHIYIYMYNIQKLSEC